MTAPPRRLQRLSSSLSEGGFPEATAAKRQRPGDQEGELLEGLGGSLSPSVAGTCEETVLIVSSAEDEAEAAAMAA
eukprot:15431600-Alexandrium_andersonii.AAC.1